MLIDTTVREWSSPYSPRLEPCTCANFFHILSFDLRIGNLSFFGGDPFTPVDFKALYFDSEEYPLGTGTFEAVPDWFLEGTGDYSADNHSGWYGHDHRFFDSDGTHASVSDIFQEAPAFIEMRGYDGNLDHVYMNLTRVARVPEPPALLLFGIGIIGLGFARRKQRLDSPVIN